MVGLLSTTFKHLRNQIPWSYDPRDFWNIINFDIIANYDYPPIIWLNLARLRDFAEFAFDVLLITVLVCCVPTVVFLAS